MHIKIHTVVLQYSLALSKHQRLPRLRNTSVAMHCYKLTINKGAKVDLIFIQCYAKKIPTQTTKCRDQPNVHSKWCSTCL